MINPDELDVLRTALEKLESGSADLPQFESTFDTGAVSEVMQQVAERMQDNYPYFHPLYAGQMLKPPHPVARIAYALSLWINPNNHALDGGRASSAMEKECIVELGRMFGWEAPLGHLAGGGTMANLEALWIASQLQPGQRIVASEQAHYTHARLCEVLGIPFTAVRCTPAGHMDLSHLDELLDQGNVGTVVATIGNTGFGDVDPLPEILVRARESGVRVHADAAYGGYFTLASELGDKTRAAYDCLTDTDSIVIDPHKHGLQPYGCGCVLFRDPADGRFYKHDSPYTYFSSEQLHLGEISLECSRPGASAVALWATHRLLPPAKGGTFARDLDRCLRAGREFWARLDASSSFHPLMRPELDIVVYAVDSPDTATASARASRLFELAAEDNLHLALIELPAAMLRTYAPDIRATTDTVTCLRSVLMKPEHGEWLDPIMSILERGVSRLTESTAPASR
jgi:glutamate/tyrosine decarboxylase-like PLP-dependent enzyme